MNIETFLKSKETYQKVLDTLRTYANIEDESKGFIAGGSVSNILFSLIHGGNAVVNDIDVYWQVKEDVKLKEEQWYPAVYVNEDGLEMVDDAYGRVFVSDSGSRMRVVKHSRKGIFNNIEYLYEERKRYGVDIIKPKNLVILEGFDLNLGPGWTNLTPTTPPANCGGAGSGGQWIWLTTTTSTTLPITTVGPGYFFDLNNNGVAGDDFGDNNVGGCSWSFCFTVTVANNCTPQNLLIQVTTGSDGVWGSYTSTECDITTPVTVYNGTSNPTLPTIGLINHN